MSRYILRRLLVSVPTVIVAATGIFFLIHLIPGDPVMMMLQEHFTTESYEAVRTRMGLDRPLYEQYVSFFSRMIRGDLGTSFRTRQPVLRNVLSVLPYTIHLALAGFLISLMLAIPVGIVSSLRRGTLVDTLAMLLALLAVSIPDFWLGVLLIIVFSVNTGWLPATGAGNSSSAYSLLLHLCLPAMAVGFLGAATQARITRSAMLDVLGKEYVRTARAKGVAERTVVIRHVLRNALIPIVTVGGMDLLRLLGGTVVIETVFSRPGIGQLLVDSIAARDYPQIQGTLLAYITLIIVTNVLVDLVYALVDPRVAYV